MCGYIWRERVVKVFIQKYMLLFWDTLSDYVTKYDIKYVFGSFFDYFM